MKTMKWPSLEQWKRFSKVLTPKEKIYLLVFGACLILGGLWTVSSFYLSHTHVLPSYGGEYIEGATGQPLHINPIISQTNPVDDDLSQLIFSGLLKYDQNGSLVNDLTENYEVSDDKLTYTFHLRKDVKWHDNANLTSGDIIFTINLLSDPTYKSPLRFNWQGIETNALDEYTIEFKVKSPYVGFLNNLTFGILPKHIWENIGSEKFFLTEFNLRPIGTGPYRFRSVEKDSEGNFITYKLSANPSYFDGKPFITNLTFNFYADDDQLIRAYNTKEVMGISSLSPQRLSDLKRPQSTNIHAYQLPRYFAVFFNQTKSLPLTDDKVRRALNLATDKKSLIQDVLKGYGQLINTPFLPDMVGYSDDFNNDNFDLNKANEILDEADWKRGEDGFRAKNNTPLEFDIVTTDWEELTQTAEILKSQWEKIGVKANIVALSSTDFQQNYVRPREYDSLLFGQFLGADSDPFSFWHSSQKKDPGLNLSMFGSNDTNKLIEDARTEFNTEKRNKIYNDFQKAIVEENPATFLYQTDYLYPVNKKVQGLDMKMVITPAERFANVNRWFIKTHRIWN